jgi:hypothetical protein
MPSKPPCDHFLLLLPAPDPLRSALPTWPAADGGKPSMAQLDGRWRLLYSSGFTSGSLGGRRPGPSFASSPVTLGQVFQDISVGESKGRWSG